MASIAPERHPSLYLLMDHLQAALALGEDMLSKELALDTADRPTLRGWMKRTRDLNGFLTSVRTLEYAGTARLLQARRRADDLRRDSRLKPVLALFVGGTAQLADAARELGDTDRRDFDSTDATLTFLRSRGLLAADAAGLELVPRLTVGEDYRVAGRIRLGTLLDLATTFLETLDVLYDLHADATEAAELPAACEPGMASSAAVEPGPAT